jgi:hypothetical protein
MFSEQARALEKAREIEQDNIDSTSQQAPVIAAAEQPQTENENIQEQSSLAEQANPNASSLVESELQPVAPTLESND